MKSYKKWLIKKIKNKNKFKKYKDKDKYVYLYNCYSTKKRSKLNDNFIYNEIGHLDLDKKIIDFENLLDFCNKWCAYQNEFLLKDYQGNPLKDEELERSKKIIKDNNSKLYLSGDWVRYIDNDFPFKHKIKNKKMVYGILISLEEYLMENLDMYWDNLLDKKIPNILWKPYKEKTFIKEPNGKHYTMYDFKTRANGKEKDLEKIKVYWQKEGYILINDIVKEKIINYKNMTFRIFKNNDKYDPTSYDIISDKEAAKQIDFKNYLTSLINLQQSEQIVLNLLKDLKKDVLLLLETKLSYLK